MSDSQTVTIPAAQHAATAETRPARLLRALAQNPEPLSAPALASLLAEPGRRRRLLSAYDHTLRRHEQAGHVERAGRERNGRGRPAIIWRITTAGRGWLDDHDNAPALAAAAAAQARPRGRRTGPGTGRSPRNLHPPDSADQPQTRRSPAQRTRLHPRPDRRGLPRQQREDPPGPPLGPGGTQTPEKAQAAHAPQPQPNPTPPGSVNIGVPLKGMPVVVTKDPTDIGLTCG